MNRILLLALLLVAGIVAVPAAPAQTMGWIDVQKVIFEYKLTRDITEKLEKDIAKHRSDVRVQKERIQAMMEAMEATGSDAEPLDRLKVEKNIRLAQIDLDVQEKNVMMQLEQGLVQHMKKVYLQVVREAEAIARDRNLSVVFMLKQGDIEGRTKDELSSNIIVRPILWIDPRLDLTDEVIRRLNAK